MSKLQVFDEELITPAVTAGIWSELDRLNVYCGLSGLEIAARTNMIKNAHFVTPVSSPIFDNSGYRSGGTGYLNLNYNIATQGVKYTRNSATFGYVSDNPSFLGSLRPMGSFGGGTSRNDCERDTSGSVGSVNSSGAVRNTLKPTGVIHFNFRRPNSTTQETITNDSVTSGATTSAALVSDSTFELCLSLGGSPTGPFDTTPHRASWHGSSALDYVTLRTLLNNLFTALGV